MHVTPCVPCGAVTVAFVATFSTFRAETEMARLNKAAAFQLNISDMDEESGGNLWRTLSVEEDILKNVLMMLSSNSLKNLELTCRPFRYFIKRNQTWQKKFLKIKFHAFKYSTRSQILIDLTRPNLPSELHVKYKRICLSVESSLKQEVCCCRLCTNKGTFFPRCDYAQIRRAQFHAHYQQQVDEDEDENM